MFYHDKVQINISHRERERERESSLSSLSLKKSFTLIELSIVLLILSLLVGSLLVGRQIVDRAKIQRIIFEFDYYEKAFHQFYDTYRVVPGNVDYKTCIKYAEFSTKNAYNENGTMVVRDLCTGSAPNVAMNKKLLSPYFPQSNWGSACWLAEAKLIDAKVVCRGNFSGTGWLTDPLFNNVSEGQKWADYRVDGLHYFPQASYDTTVQIGFHGFDDLDKWGRDYKYNFRFFNMNAADAYETDDPKFRKEINKRNTMFLLNSNLGCPCKSASRNCACKNSLGGLSAKMASEIDAKIDDGRPGSGRLLAYKNDYVHQDTKPSNAEIEKVCYTGAITNVSSAIYENSTNLRYGCNIIKVMEDVK